MKILITGGTGFIGSNIITSLYEKNKIILIVRDKKNNNLFKKKNIKIINYKNYNELNNKLNKIKVDTVIHAATHYSKIHNFKDLKHFSNSNILFGNIILENINNMKVKKFINFSTVWQDYNGKKDNYFNLYSAYKRAFSNILKYYTIKEKNTKFYELIISDTFGYNDKRKKIINVLKNNYKNNILTKIVSKNLFINLLNVKDVVQAVLLINKKNIKQGRYLLTNNKNIKIYDLIQNFNKTFKKKIKVSWQSNKIIKEKTLRYNKLKSWKPLKSNIFDILKAIKN